MMIELMRRAFAPLAMVLSFIAVKQASRLPHRIPKNPAGRAASKITSRPVSGGTERSQTTPAANNRFH
jgi:hypothetical protein